MKLYELTQQYNTLLEMLDMEGMEQQAILDTLECIDSDIEAKADNIAKLIKTIEHQEEALRQEEVRLATRRKAYENHRIGLKNYLEAQMIMMGKDKIKSALFTIYIGNNPPSLKLTREEDEYPDKYQKIETKLDRKAMIDDIKSGKVIDGASLEQGKSLKIR
jgi:hypothetical protein